MFSSGHKHSAHLLTLQTALQTAPAIRNTPAWPVNTSNRLVLYSHPIIPPCFNTAARDLQNTSRSFAESCFHNSKQSPFVRQGLIWHFSVMQCRSSCNCYRPSHIQPLICPGPLVGVYFLALFPKRTCFLRNISGAPSSPSQTQPSEGPTILVMRLHITFSWCKFGYSPPCAGNSKDGVVGPSLPKSLTLDQSRCLLIPPLLL